MNVFATAEKHMSWLAARQAIASINMANSDTPGFKARAITAFGQEMKFEATRLFNSNPAHFQSPMQVTAGQSTTAQNNEEVTITGNDVSMEKEMRTIGENSRVYSFDIGLLKSFHRLILASVKG
jgi:flagellar basal-body rod protein FlgB